MPTDPVYNPHLPTSSTWTPSSSAMRATSPWTGNVSSSGEHSSWSALSAGLVAGAVAGAALALIFAPARGTDIRGSIRRYASDRAHRASDVIQKRRSAFARGVSSLRATNADSPAFNASMSTATSRSGSQPLTASVAEISGIDRRFEEPLGG